MAIENRPPPGAAGPVRVALYGDSLAFEAQEPFSRAVTAEGRAAVQAHVFGGTAICDWLPQMRADAATWRPEAVVVEFSGNAFTPCMRDRSGVPLSGQDRNAKYVADARQVLGISSPAGVRIYFASYPITRGAAQSHSSDWARLNSLYASLADGNPQARFVDAATVVEDRDHYTDSLPCRTDEPCTGGLDATGHGVNVVRAPDGVHFCPGAPDATDGVTGTCPVWSSGSFRYGKAMATPVVEDFGL